MLKGKDIDSQMEININYVKESLQMLNASHPLKCRLVRYNKGERKEC